MHTLFNLSDRLPQFIHISNGKVSDDIGVYYVLPRKGSVIVADRGYRDTSLLHDWDSSGICFVVRLRRDLHDRRLGELEQPDEGEQNILIDEAIQFSGEDSSCNYKHPIRRVVVYDKETMQEPIELLTNNAKWSAETVAALYKARRDIKIFFKTIKQLLRMLKAQSKFAWHKSNLVSFLRLNLFNKIDLRKWLNEPLEKPPPRQKTLWEGCFSSFALSLPDIPHDYCILFPSAQTLGQVWILPALPRLFSMPLMRVLRRNPARRL